MADPIVLASDGGFILKLQEVTSDPTDDACGVTGGTALLYFQKGVGPRVKRYGLAAENLFLSSTASAADAILEIRRGAALGVASLDASAKITLTEITEVMAITDLTDVAAKSGTSTTVLFQTAPSITSPNITTSITMNTDNNVDIGTNEKRVKSFSIVSSGFKVYNTVSAANAVLTLGNASITLGAGGGTAQDTRIYRSTGNTLTIDNAAGGAGNLIVMGDLTVQGTTTTINSTVVDIKDRIIHMNHDTGTATAIPALAAGFSIHRGAVAGTARGHAAMLWINDSDKVSAASGTGCFIVCDNPTGDDATVGTLVPFRCGTLYIGVNSRFILSESGLGSACTFTIYNKGGEIVTASGTQTLTNKTLTTPTIVANGWTNANHDHSSAAAGGTLTGSAFSSSTGTGPVVLANSPTIITPVIASFTSAQHSHGSAAGGAQLNPTVIFASYTGSGTTVVLSGNPVITAPTIGTFVNSGHNHQNAAGGGQLTGAAISTTTGSGTTVVLSGNPVITSPTIGDFTNSTHTHQNAAGGGQITGAAISTTTGSGTTVVLSGNPVITAPTIGTFVNSTHNHQNAAGGGQLTGASISTTTGSGTTVVLSGNPTITSPVIADLSNMTHSHGNAAGGGQLTPTTCFASTTGSGTTVVLSGNPTLTAPVIGTFVNSTHNHQNAAGGGQLTPSIFASTTGSGTTVVLSGNPVLTAPGIAIWDNANHTHTSVASGGQLTSSAIGYSTTGSGSTMVLSGAPTISNPRISEIIGGTTSAATITITATTHTSAGAIIFNNKTGSQCGRFLATGELIIGTATALIGSEFVSIQKSFNGITLLGVYNATNNTAASAQVLAKSDVAQLALQVFATNYTGASKWARLYATGATKLVITTADTAYTQIGANGYGYLTVYDGGSMNLGGGDSAAMTVQYPLSMTTTYVGASSVISWNKSDNAAAINLIEIDTGTTNLVDGRLGVTNNNGFVSASGRVANEFSMWSNVGGIGLITAAAQVIRLCTTSTERMRILAASNTLQGNGGLAVQGGAESGNALTLTGSAANNPTAKVSICGSAEMLAFFGVTGIIRQTGGENLTNNVTASGTTGTIEDFSDLSTYATDAVAIRRDIYQLARMLKQDHDALRAYGLLT